MRSLPAKRNGDRLVPFKKIAPSRLIKLGKNSKAAVIVDKKGAPLIFVFDTPAFLDMLSDIDEALIDKLSTEEYHNPSVNPAGVLIDKIEATLPLNPRFVFSLKEAISEAGRKGWVSAEDVKRRLGLE